MPVEPPPQTQADWLIDANAEQLALLRTILAQQGVLMATVQDLKAVADQLQANEAALASEVATLSTAVDGLVTQFNLLSGHLSAADQATLDAAVQQVTDAAADLANQTQSLSAEQGEVDTANPPAPAPEPAPTPTPTPEPAPGV